jgi:SH3-like domain-containing protein
MKARTKVHTLAALRLDLRTLITYALLLALATSMLLVAYAPAFAQAETGTLTDIGEGDSRVLTSNLTTLAPGQQITYQFAYDGDEQPVAVTMNVIPADAATFEIWTDERLEQLSEDSETEPLGRGTAMQEGSGFTNWQGGSTEAETYYVVVTAGDSAASFVLNVTSPALAEDQPGAVAVEPEVSADPNIATVTTDALNVRSGPSTAFPVLVTVPNGTEMSVLGRNAINTWINVALADGTVGWVTRSLTNYTTISPNIISPAGTIGATVGATATVTSTTVPTGTTAITPTTPLTATELGGNWQTLESGGTAWYSFQYRGGDLPLTVWMDLEPFAAAEFVVMDATTAESIMAGTTITPTDVITDVIGRGRANPVEPGYLYWQADFAEADTYYVLVQPTDDATVDVLYTITALGPGVGRIIEPVE